MKNNDQKPGDDQRPVFAMLQQINDGSIDPSMFTREQRLPFVEVLFDDGVQPPAMARLLQVSEKTIKRDVDYIVKKRQDMSDPALSEDVAREILVYAKIHRAHLMRLSRLKEASTSEKVYAETSASRVVLDAATKLQSLGYLRTVPQAVVGEVVHRAGSPESEASFSELKAMVIEVINTAKETNTLTPELQQEAEALGLKIVKAEISSEIAGLLEKSPKGEEQK